MNPGDRTMQDRETAAQVSRSFMDEFGARPFGVWNAPGRVNLIGEHLDYNHAPVLPFAIDRSARVAVGAGEHGRTRVVSTIPDRYTGRHSEDVFENDTLVPGSVTGWAAGIAGVIWALQQRAGRVLPGVNVLVDSTVPLGAGLSSSHAVEVAVALALRDHFGAPLDRKDLALITQEAENRFLGAPTGIMDQCASLLSVADHALLLDCQDLSVDHVPLELGPAGLRVLAVDTTVVHSNADGGYAERRAACERAARALGVPHLGRVPEDADLSGVAAPDRPRVRHVVSERRRVAGTVHALRTGDWTQVGQLLSASHVSLRDDFEVSCAELDTAVDAMLAAGALGARMTGAGFGGTAIGLVPERLAEEVADAVARAFREQGWSEPRTFTVVPGPGARRLA